MRPKWGDDGEVGDVVGEQRPLLVAAAFEEGFVFFGLTVGLGDGATGRWPCCATSSM